MSKHHKPMGRLIDPMLRHDVYACARIPVGQATELFGQEAVDAWNTAVTAANERHAARQQAETDRYTAALARASSERAGRASEWEGGIPWTPTKI